MLSSVHSFAQSAIGPLFFAFIGVTFITSLGLIIYRWGDLQSETRMNSLLSREAMFLYNNLLVMGILVVCFWGVIRPLISELFTGSKVTVGPPYYEMTNSPLFAIMILLIAIAPCHPGDCRPASTWHSRIKLPLLPGWVSPQRSLPGSGIDWRWPWDRYLRSSCTT